MVGLPDHLRKLLRQSILVLHGLKDLLAGELLPGRRDDHGVGVMLAQQGDGGCQLFLADGGSTAENDAGRRLNLIRIELTEILQIDLAFCRVRHGDEAAQCDFVRCNAFHRTDHITELANAGRLDKNAVRLVLRDHLLQRAAEIPDKRTADAPGVHFIDLDAGFLHEAAVNTDLTELVFYEDKLFSLIGFPDHLLDERGLARAKKTGINVDDCHCFVDFLSNLHPEKQMLHFSEYYSTISEISQVPKGFCGIKHNFRLLFLNSMVYLKNPV